jgi:hypothetical protein
MNLGWEVTKVQEVRSRKYKGFQKHLVVFRNPDIMIKGENGDDSFPQILLTNSHDGKAAFNFRVGIFRLVCSNGLVISDADFNNVSIRHTNYTFESLQTKINEIIATKKTVNIMDVLSATRTEDQGNDLWVVFNRVQEKILGGSYTSGGRKARSVKNFQKDIQLNEQLFELAESYL